jgi:hypothetical protein
MMTPREITRAKIQEIADRYGVTPEILAGWRHPRRLLRARVELAESLAARGSSATQIAVIMNRDHSTVYFYLGRLARHQPSPRSLALARPVEPAPPPAPKPRRPIPYAGHEPKAPHHG